MNLYKISQTENEAYDTYDKAIVAAKNERDARNTHPCVHQDAWDKLWHDWARSPENVKVELIGTAIEGTEAGVICASFNAG